MNTFATGADHTFTGSAVPCGAALQRLSFTLGRRSHKRPVSNGKLHASVPIGMRRRSDHNDRALSRVERLGESSPGRRCPPGRAMFRSHRANHRRDGAWMKIGWRRRAQPSYFLVLCTLVCRTLAVHKPRLLLQASAELNATTQQEVALLCSIYSAPPSGRPITTPARRLSSEGKVSCCSPVKAQVVTADAPSRMYVQKRRARTTPAFYWVVSLASERK